MKARVRYHLDIDTNTMDVRKLRRLGRVLRSAVEVVFTNVRQPNSDEPFSRMLSVLDDPIKVRVTFDSAEGK